MEGPGLVRPQFPFSVEGSIHLEQLLLYSSALIFVPVIKSIQQISFKLKKKREVNPR